MHRVNTRNRSEISAGWITIHAVRSPGLDAPPPGSLPPAPAVAAARAAARVAPPGAHYA
jgi:hypothetical protein